jgi:hypothetical protein
VEVVVVVGGRVLVGGLVVVDEVVVEAVVTVLVGIVTVVVVPHVPLGGILAQQERQAAATCLHSERARMKV